MRGLGTGIRLERAGTGGGRIEISGDVEQSKEIGGLRGDRWAAWVVAPAIIRRWPRAWVGPPGLGERIDRREGPPLCFWACEEFLLCAIGHE